MKKATSKLLAAALAAFAIGSAAHAVSIADLTHGYDVFVQDNVTIGGVRMHGSTAAGNNLKITASTAEFNLDGNHVAPYTIVAGNAIELNGNGRVLSNGGRGKVSVGNLLPNQSISVNANQIFLNAPAGQLDLSNTNQTAGQILTPSGIDFDAAFSGLKTLSNSLKNLLPTLPVPAASDLVFDFTGAAGLQILNLTAAQFGAFGQTNQIGNISSGVRFLVNVDLTGFSGVLGQNVNQNVSDSNASGILWNFYGAGLSEVEIRSKWVGSILAPELSVVDKNSNDIRGSVIAKSFSKSGGQVHPGSFNYDFDLPPPPSNVPDASSTVVLAALGLPILFIARRRRA